MRRIFIFKIFLLLHLIFPDISSSAEMGNYCSVPVLTGTAVSPNILFVVDVSGSMGWAAYNPRSDGRGWCTDSDGCGNYNPAAVYEGYFIPDKVYIYDSGNGVWVEAPAGTNPSTCPNRAYRYINRDPFIEPEFVLDTTKAYTGSCLNFLLMSRIDLVRWAITGGMPASCNGVNDNDCVPELFYRGVDNNNWVCDNDGCILRSINMLCQYRIIFGNQICVAMVIFEHDIKVPWSRIFDALVYKMKEMSVRPRFGVMFYSGGGIRDEKVYIGDFVSSNNIDEEFPYKNMIMHINGIDVGGATPTAPALWDAYNYFAQNSPEYNGFQPQTGDGNKWKNPIYQCIDKNKDGKCQASEFEKVPCAKNFVILMTDGQWNVGGPPNNVRVTCTIDRGFENHSADPVVPAYWLHAKGFTNQITGDQLRVDAVYTIGLWLGGTGENSLKHVAMYGSFDLSNGRTWPGGMTDYPMDYGCWIDDCTRYTDGNADADDKGSPCTPLPSSSPDWDENGDGVPDTFYNARNAIEIRNSVEKIILEILKKVSSGSGVASMSSRSDVASVVLQPSYYPFYITPEGRKVSWIGLLDSFWFDFEGNFREDTVNSLQLDIDRDPDAVDEDRTFFMDYAEIIGPHAIFANLDPDDTGNKQCQFIERKTLFEVKGVVDFACKLAERDGSTRTIHINDGTPNLIEFSSGNSGAVDLVSSIWTGIDGTLTQDDVKCIMDYLRGEDVNCTTDYAQRSFRFNISDLCGKDQVAIWKLGDIMNSPPAIVSFDPNNIYHKRYLDVTYSEFINSDEYRKRATFAFIGANDGMLHAFRIGFIKENKYCTNDPTRSCRKSSECGDGGFCVFDPENPVKIQNDFNDSGTDKIGQEEWAFIPYNALPYLLWYGHKDYCHIHTVDYRFTVVDVSINGPATSDKTKDSWRTVLIGVMGFGGQKIVTGDENGNGVCDTGETNCKVFSSSVFAIDLTDWLANPSSNKPILLWETALPDNTLTLSLPVVVRQGDKKKNGEWYVVIGSGPKDPHGNDFVSDPKIYFIDLRTGNIVNSVSVLLPSGIAGAAVGNIRSIDVDNDYQDDILYFGVYGEKTNGIQWGAFYRFHLISQPGTYIGIAGLSSVNISEVISLSDFCQTSYCPTVIAQPEFGADIDPETGNARLWIFFGTGKMLNEDDKLTKKKGYKNYLFGFVDECWDPSKSGCPNTLSRSDLKDVTLETTRVKLDTSETAEICICGTVCDNAGCNSYCNFETVYVKVGDPVSYIEDVTELGYKGWYIEFTGRVVMSTPVLVGTILDALSYEPSDNICGVLGDTYLTAVNFKSGTPPPKPTGLWPENVTLSGGNEGIITGGGTGKHIGKGAPPQGTKPMDIRSTKEVGQYEKMIQLSTGVTVKQRQQLRFIGGKFMLWMER